jgi:hypothetical protein
MFETIDNGEASKIAGAELRTNTSAILTATFRWSRFGRAGCGRDLESPNRTDGRRGVALFAGST